MTDHNIPRPTGLEVPARAVPDMLFRIASDGVILDAKPGENIEFHVPLEAFLGQPLSEVLPPHVAGPATTAIRATQRDGLIHTFDYQLEGDEGIGYFEARVIRAGNDEVIAIVRNMTERYLAQAMLATQSAVAEHMAEGAAILRQNGEAIVWANTRMEAMLGYDVGALNGLTVEELIADTHAFLPTVRASLARRGRWLGERRLRHRQGSGVWCELSISSFDHPTLGPVMVVLASDISERQAIRITDQASEQVGQPTANRETGVSELAHALAAAITHVTGDCCSVSLADKDAGQVRAIACCGCDSDCSHMLRQLAAASTQVDTDGAKSTAPPTGTTTANDIAEESQRELLGGESATLRGSQRFHSVITASIVVGGTGIGTITTVRHESGRPYLDQDVSLIEDVAARAGPVLENARIRRELVEGEEFVSSTQAGIARIGADLTVLSWNPGAEAITGYSAAEMIGQPISILGRSTQTHTEERQRFAKLVKADSPIQFQVERAHKDGSAYWLSIDLSPIHGAHGAVVGAAASFVDVTAQRNTRAELETLARADQLTGLANRTEFNEALSRAFVRHRRFGIRGALLVIDLDDFKRLNDEHGQQVGDDILREVAVQLRREGRETDVAARIGSDEFGVLVDPADLGLEGAVEVARRLLNAIGKPFQVAGESLRLQASCGIALLPEDGRSPDALLQHAEEAMFSARLRGGGRVEHYGHPGRHPGQP